jgi:hypothetical protein
VFSPLGGGRKGRSGFARAGSRTFPSGVLPVSAIIEADVTAITFPRDNHRRYQTFRIWRTRCSNRCDMPVPLMSRGSAVPIKTAVRDHAAAAPSAGTTPCGVNTFIPRSAAIERRLMLTH